MTTTKSFDPFKMWKNIYDQTESDWSGIIQQSMRKETFSEGMGETLNPFLQFQELSRKMTESYLEQMNVPSRDEVANVASLVINLEEKIDGLEEGFEENSEKLNKEKEIGQLRKSITNLDKKMDKILQAIDKLNVKEQPASIDTPVNESKNKKK